jgi:hypothetical protein
MECDMAKKMKIKLPKRVAGVKIPKVIRKGPVGEFLNSGAGQVILAETLVAAAALFTASKTDDVRRLGKSVAGSSVDQTERLSRACKAAGQAFRNALQGDDAEVWEATPEPAPVKSKTKKKSSARASSTTTH